LDVARFNLMIKREPAMSDTSTAMAVLDIGNRADEDNEMETDADLLRRDIGAGFNEVNARIDGVRRETTERVDELRRETTARIDALRNETAERIAELRRETILRMEDVSTKTAAHIAQLSQEMHARIDALDVKIDAVRRESLAAIADSRKEALDHFLSLQAQMNELRRETTARIDAFSQEINRRMDRSDVQFRWLVGLMLTSLLATAGLFARAAHLL
jgi:hypothetical protein